MAQVSRKLIVGKPITLPDDVNEDLIFDIDVALAEEYCKNKEYENVISKHKKFENFLIC